MALSRICIAEHTVDEILARVRDISEDVRKQAFSVIANISLSKLELEQRIAILSDGLYDRNEEVKTACTKMFCGLWFEQAGNNMTKVTLFFEATDLIFFFWSI